MDSGVDDDTAGSLMVAWQLKGRRVLIVGGGEVASQRLKNVLSTGADVTLIAPRKGLHPVVGDLITASPYITYHDRTFSGEDDLKQVDMVLTAIDDVAASQEICTLCRALRVPVNVADVPSSCDFYFGAQLRNGPLQVMISTNGNGPRLAALIKRRIEKALPENVGEAVEKVGTLRKRLRQRAPGTGGDLGKRRMKWISGVCEAWTMEDLARLDEDAIERLLDEGWEHDVVLRARDVLPRSSLARLWCPHMDRLGPFSIGFLAGLLATATAMFAGGRKILG